MTESTAEQRENWQAFECNPDKMTRVQFGPDKILVATPTVDAWKALARVLEANEYSIRTPDTDSYNCREIKGGGGKSLHSYGIALDVNWDTNPYRTTSDQRSVRFSDKPTQAQRAEDVRLGRADTDMTPQLIADVLAIKTKGGKRVFEWGGNWKSVKDTMHFEIDLTPGDLASGIDLATVRGPEEAPAPPVVGRPVLEYGSRGEEVRELQRILLVDGIFGPVTEAAVKAFQKARGLEEDGIVGPETWAALHAPEPTQEPWHDNIYATTWGGNAETEFSAYDGKRITENEIAASLPYSFAIPPILEVRNHSTGKTVDIPTRDKGPWNTNDAAYVIGGERPQAESGTDTRGRKTNKAGIDLSPAAVRALGFEYSSKWSGYVDWRIKPEPGANGKESFMSAKEEVVVPVKGAAQSKINWTQAVGVLASILVLVGVDVPAETQAHIVLGIQAVQAVITWALKTFFSNTVTPSSVGRS